VKKKAENLNLLLLFQTNNNTFDTSNIGTFHKSIAIVEFDFLANKPLNKKKDEQ